MKYSSPNLPLGLVIAALVLLATATVPLRGAELSGQQLVAEAARRLALQPALAARIRQRANLFGQELVGSGSYQQVLAKGRTLIRLELKLQVDEQLTTLQQVSTAEEILWIRRDQGNNKTVSYVNLRQIREATRRAGPAQPGTLTVDTLALAGLPQLIQGLEQNFQFGRPVEETMGDIPVWVIRGEWKKEKLAALAVKKEAGADSSRRWELLPAHLPHGVTVALGRDDFVPLFPYRIDFARYESAAANGSRSNSRAGEADDLAKTVVSMEFFEVRRQWDIDPQAFDYDPGNEHVDNCTDLYLQRLGLPAQDTATK
jgi:hypothetical protein